MGSLRYAIEHLGDSLRLPVVLGRSGCGAATAAVDVCLSPSAYLPLANSEALRGLIDRLLIVVQASALALASVHGEAVRTRARYRAALIEMVIAVNAALAARTIGCELGHAGLAVVYGVYLLERRHVWVPRPGADDWTGLADPPRDEHDFRALGVLLARSERIASLL